MTLSIYLFSLNLEIALILGFIFILIFPILLNFFKNNNILLTIYLLTYLIVLTCGVLLEITISNHTVYFSLTITDNWFSNKLSLAFFDPLSVLINIFLLFPIGYLIPCLIYKHKLIRVILSSLFISIFIEFLQFSLPIKRSPEVLDVLNNLISGILGYLYYLFLNKLSFRGELNDKLSKQENTN